MAGRPRDRLKTEDDERFVRGVVARLTRTHETRAGLARPRKMTDSSEDYIDPMLADIVGIDVDITRIVGQWKLSQNKEERDRLSAAEELLGRGALSVSEAMPAIGSRE
jgi:transcriptional regulator